MELKRLILALGLLTSIAYGQAKKPTIPPLVEKQPQTFARWGGLYSVKIPQKCSHLRMMKNKATCRVHLAFHDIPPLPVWRLRFRTWDDDGGTSEDTIYRIYLADPTYKGIYVQGVLGHTILVEVTYR